MKAQTANSAKNTGRAIPPSRAMKSLSMMTASSGFAGA
jgi:hypothetical protein